jgi:hypothetical protein
MPGKHNAGGCGCCNVDECSGCVDFETVSVDGSVAVASGHCPDDFPVIDGTYTVEIYFGQACQYYNPVYRNECVVLPNFYLDAIDVFVFLAPAATAAADLLPNGDTITFPYSTGFRCLVVVDYYGNYTDGDTHSYYQDFETCPSGVQDIPYYDSTIATTNPINTTAPTSVSVNWP